MLIHGRQSRTLLTVEDGRRAGLDALSLSGPSACVVPARLLYDCCHVTNSYVFCFPLIPPASGQRLNFIIKFCSVLFCSGRASDSGARGRGFDPHSGRRVVSLSNIHLPPKTYW